MPPKTKAKAQIHKSHNGDTAHHRNTSNTRSNGPISTNTEQPLVTSSNITPQNNLSPKNSTSSPMTNAPVSEAADLNDLIPNVNRKKQKRRLKEAARKAATESNQTGRSSDGSLEHSSGRPSQELTDNFTNGKHSTQTHANSGFGHVQIPGEFDDANHNYIIQEPAGGAKRKSKKGPQSSAMLTDNSQSSRNENYLTHHPTPPGPAMLSAHTPAVAHYAREDHKDRIWNTSTAEERERIKVFWLGLAETERRGLVRIEKEAVLKKMKEQQKHSCSCTVCGRKRTAIEEELEVLYDAYYDELETYANHQHFVLDATALPPPRAYDRPRMIHPPNPPSKLRGAGASSSGFVEEFNDVDEEGYSGEDDDDLSEEELESPIVSSGGIFNFGNSLTAQGGILTVADDLLKNDGKKFIEMMEQLAERRMQREEESRMVANGMGHPSMRHPPEEDEEDGYDDDEEEDEEDEDEYNSDEEDEFEDDEMEAMSEEQRMEEGRRMFQIFAARMFEQRVLTAYRQKVAEERQQKLIEELAEDEKLDAQREAKRAKEAQKKKEKRQKQKQLKDEEKAKREAEKAAEEAAIRELEEKKAEEQRLKKEAQRKKKEVEKRAVEEDRKRKEEERQKQLRERKEQQAETERKQKAQKEKEKKKREEAKLQEREEREAKEQETREREANTKAEQLVKLAPIKQPESIMNKTPTIVKRPSPATTAIPSTPANLQLPQPPSAHASPRLHIATPAIPKPPTPSKIRKRSIHDPQNPSPKLSQNPSSQTASPATSSEHHGSAVPTNHSRKSSQTSSRPFQTQASRLSPVNAPPGLMPHPPGLTGPHSGLTNGFSPTFGGTSAALTGQGHALPYSSGLHDLSNGAGTFRRPSIPFPPGIHPGRPFHSGAQGAIGSQLPHTAEPGSKARYNDPADFSGTTHSRNDSTSSNLSPRESLQRPAPIQRPSSVTPHHQHELDASHAVDADDVGRHLGSSALLDDTEDAAPASAIDDLRRGSVPVGSSRTMGPGPIGSGPAFTSTGMGGRTEGGPQTGHKLWSNSQQTPFSPPGLHNQSFVSTPGFGRPAQGGAFGSAQSTSRAGPQRLSKVRTLICEVCDRMSHYNPMSQGWHLASTITGELQSMIPRSEHPVQIYDVLQACDLEGNGVNGGGHFDFRGGEHTGFLIKHLAGNEMPPMHRGHPPIGDIGNMIPGSTSVKPSSHGTNGGFAIPGSIPTGQGF